MKSRQSIRFKIMAMLAVPLSILVGIWLFAVSVTLRSALDLRSAGTTSAHLSDPAEAMVGALQGERRLTMLYLAGDRRGGPDLTAQRARTDAAQARFRRESGGADVRAAIRVETRQRIAATVTALDGLAKLRSDVDRGGSLDQARQGYSSIIAAAYGILQTLAPRDDAQVGQEATGVVALSLSRELLSQEDALLSDFLTDRQLTAADHDELVGVVARSRLMLPYAVTSLPAATQARYQSMVGGAAFTKLRTVEDALVAAASGTAPPLDLARWRAAFDPANQLLDAFRAAAQQANVAHAERAANLILLRLGLASLAGLAGVVASVVLSVRIARSIVRRLVGLRDAATELAGHRLPSVVARLRRGEPVDATREAPPLQLGDDEIGAVGAALNAVRHTAVQSAVEEASVRHGMNEVFLNIARRSQTLLHRQLEVLDTMERRSSEPDDLADLFRVDHLATRMRRHAEDLVILAGATPGRGWRHPVPMVDVIRGAVSEVEDYARVQVQDVGDTRLAGRAVGDVIHLLAELVENATMYSPPHTRVQVSGQPVPSGFVVEIEDRGLGLPDADLAEANRRLADPPEFDPAMSSRLGLFVVARLAARHGVRVSLRASVFGGVTAVVLVPDSVMAAGPAGPPEYSAPAHRAAAPVAPVSPALPPVTRPVVVPDGPAVQPLPRVRVPVETDPPGLPRRIRQRSLAPQLRGVDAVVGEVEPASDRSAEEMRARMSSFQRGSHRGRQGTGEASERAE
jgi:signal transduction histidine kinase